MKLLSKIIAGIVATFSFSYNASADTNYRWDLLVLNRDTQQPLKDVPIHCIFTDLADGGRKTESSCTTDPSGRCSTTSQAKSSFFIDSNQNALCTPTATGFAREFDYTTRKVNGAVEMTFRLVPGPLGDRFKPEYYRSNIKIMDDDLDVTARLVSPSIQLKGVELTLRSFINKSNGKMDFQLYSVITYREERGRHYYLATGATKRGPVPLKVTQIDYLPNCKGTALDAALCQHSETLGIDLTDLIPELAESVSTEEERNWRMRFSAKSGQNLDVEIPIALFVALYDATRIHRDKIMQNKK